MRSSGAVAGRRQRRRRPDRETPHGRAMRATTPPRAALARSGTTPSPRSCLQDAEHRDHHGDDDDQERRAAALALRLSRKQAK